MAFDITKSFGTANLSAQFFDKTIKQIAPRLYKFKQAVSIDTTSAFTNYFFREDTTVLSGKTGSNVKGIPPGAAFPQASVSWTRVSTVIRKYGLEENIPWETMLISEIDITTRTAIKIAEGVIKAVDDEIWDTLSEGQSPSAIQEVVIANNFAWDQASAAIFGDIGKAKKLLGVANYPTTGLICFISPQGQEDIDNYIFEKGAQAPKLGEDAARNGSIGKVNGVSFVVSNSVTASFALVVVPKRVGTWKVLVPLSTNREDDKFKSTTFRAVEMGTTQLTDPLASVLIKNTQSA